MGKQGGVVGPFGDESMGEPAVLGDDGSLGGSLGGSSLGSSAPNSSPTDNSSLLQSSLPSLPLQSLPMALESLTDLEDTEVGTIPLASPWPVSIDQPGETTALASVSANQPANNGSDHDPQTGRFLPGNRYRRLNGNPNARTAAKARKRFFSHVDTPEFEEGLTRLFKQFAAGNHSAQKLVFAYIYGQPEAMDLMKQIVRLESLVIEGRAGTDEDSEGPSE